MFRGLKGRSHIGIHVDEEVLLDLHLLIPLKNPRLDPLGELNTENGVNHISQPLTRQLGNLLAVGQIGHDFRATDCVLHHGLDGKSFILGAVDILEAVALQS